MLREAVQSVALNMGARKPAESKGILRQRGNDVLLTKLGKSVKGLVFGGFFGGEVGDRVWRLERIRGSGKIMGLFIILYSPNTDFKLLTYDPQQEIQLVSWSSTVVLYM